MVEPTDDDVEAGRRLVSGAIGFCEAARLMYENAPDAWVVSFVNLGFGAELALKGFLRAKGRTRGELRALGHKLDDLLADACSLGLQPHQATADYVAALHEKHADHSLRYLEGGPVVDLPDFGPTYATIRDLANRAGEQAGVFPPGGPIARHAP